MKVTSQMRSLTWRTPTSCPASAWLTFTYAASNPDAQHLIADLLGNFHDIQVETPTIGDQPLVVVACPDSSRAESLHDVIVTLGEAMAMLWGGIKSAVGPQDRVLEIGTGDRAPLALQFAADGAIVTAKSLVVKDVEPFAIVEHLEATELALRVLHLRVEPRVEEPADRGPGQRDEPAGARVRDPVVALAASNLHPRARALLDRQRFFLVRQYHHGRRHRLRQRQ